MTARGILARGTALLLAMGALPAWANTPSTLRFATTPGIAAELQSLDLYPAACRAPVFVYVHGGGWGRGDKTTRRAPVFTTRGYAFASINYRLRPAATIDDAATDVASALAYLRANAVQLKIDPDRIALTGHSAGAHLAALVALDPRFLKAAGVPRSSVRLVSLLDSGGYDIADHIAKGDTPPLYRRVFGDDAADWRRYSPVTYARAGAAKPPVFVLHHIANRPTTASQAAALAAGVRAAGGEAMVFEAKGKTHGSLWQEFGNPGDVPAAELFGVADPILKPTCPTGNRP